MARLFDDASTEYLALGSAPITGPAFTVSMWFYPDAVAWGIMWSISDTAADNNRFWLERWGADPSNLHFVVLDGGTIRYATTSNDVTENAWNHAIGIAAAADDRTCILNGDTVNKGTSVDNETPTGIDETSIGCLKMSSIAGPWSGGICGVAMWNTALSEAQAVTLSTGVLPLFVQPANLVSYWPLIRHDNDIKGSNHMTAYNTPSFMNHYNLAWSRFVHMRGY